MSKPTLTVPGVDPADIECRTDPEGMQRVMFGFRQVATLGRDGPVFDGSWSDAIIRDACQKVMNACIDHWRATGRLFPNPPQPVGCVCGGNGKLRIDGRYVFCTATPCHLAASTVDQWNIMQAALKAAK